MSRNRRTAGVYQGRNARAIAAPLAALSRHVGRVATNEGHGLGCEGVAIMSSLGRSTRPLSRSSTR